MNNFHEVNDMDYMKVSKAAEKWELSARRVRVLCQENRIQGVIRKGNLYMIPAEAKKPEDGRSKGRNRTTHIIRAKCLW